jgi:electron-transferring-flavoprotein dehydrogenase
VLEKAAELGEHCLSGAVVNPGPFRELFPDLSDEDFPFRGAGGKEAVYLMRGFGARPASHPPHHEEPWEPGGLDLRGRPVDGGAGRGGLGERLPRLPRGFAPGGGGRVVGSARRRPGWTGRGIPGSGAHPAMDLTARVTVLSEGTRGPLTQGWMDWQGIRPCEPPDLRPGVKELWEVKKPLDRVIHTLGWPLPNDAFGGSWIYPMGDGPGLAGAGGGAGLPGRPPRRPRPPAAAQAPPPLPGDPGGGEMVEWGAKTIPEGGYYSVPERRHGTAPWSWETRRGTWTCRPSRGSTTRSSPESWRPGPSSGPSRPTTPPRRGWPATPRR